MTDPGHHHEGMPRWAWGLLLAAATFAVLLLFHLGERSPLRRFAEKLELKALDTMFQLREDVAPTSPDERIEIVVVDDEGYEYFDNYSYVRPGFPDVPFPWPRFFYARLVDYMHAAGARVVFFDFLFSGLSPYDLAEVPDAEQFATSCEGAGNVYQSLLFGEPEGWGEIEAETRVFLEDLRAARLADYDLELLHRHRLGGGVEPSRSFEKVQLPLEQLAAAAHGLGAVNADIDPDGVVRRVRPLVGYGDGTYPSIQLALARDVLGVEEVAQDSSGDLLLGDLRVPLGEDGCMLVNWHGGAQTYPYHSMHKFVEQVGAFETVEFEPDPRFAGKIVLVGTSATGLADLKANPFGSRFPGVEAHAAALDNLLNGDFLRHGSLGLRLGWTALLLLVAGQALARRQAAATGVVVLLVLLALQLVLGFGAFVRLGLWVDQVIPVVGLVLLFAGAQTLQYFTEGRQKRAIRGAFQRYLPPSVVDEVLKVPLDELKLGGDRRELTVFFSDIRGFTGISETLAPEELVSMLNVYLGEMTDIISRNHGTLDKYIGDSIMAFWGAPLPVEQPAVAACMSALENHERLAELREEFRARGLPELYARIGINTGPMLVGNMGSDQHFSYTVMGDAVNLASRLEGAGKQYGVSILIGSATHEAAREHIEVREIDLIRVKGKAAPERVFELLARRGELSEAQERLRGAFLAGLEAYRARDWAAATARFEAALEIEPGDGPSRVYLERCRLYTDEPPPADWDGVFVMATK